MSSEKDIDGLSRVITGASSTDDTAKLKLVVADNPLLIVNVRDPDPCLSASGVMLTLHPEPETTGVEADTMAFELTLT